ncbi:MAG: SUMF1/EgtB/PvdO family nonheme iron enzyme [Solirubrobacterales bacterium]
MSPIATVTDATELLAASRRRTLDLIEHVPTADMERVLSEPMSPLVWDLAHIASYEDLWIGHHYGGLSLLHPELAEMYDAFETPRAIRGELPLLDTSEALEYLDQVRARVLEVLDEKGPDPGGFVELVAYHEFQHTETMRQAMALADELPAGEPPANGPWDELPAGDDWIEVPSGTFQQGATGEGFAYDNERPRHEVELDSFRIARRPVSNADWREFIEAGGYDRPELWSAEGLEWKEDLGVSRHQDSLTAPPPSPVGRICWFEADAYAKFVGQRLPTESEWERAAGAGLLELVGEVWEWTSSGFDAYPGFEVYPYPEYSEVFFGGNYFMLRGGSWATDPLIKSSTFRNWDLPQRRQLFAGLRLAADPEETNG